MSWNYTKVTLHQQALVIQIKLKYVNERPNLISEK